MTKITTPPPADSANPGHGPVVRCAFSNAERTWEENVDLVELLAETLRDRGLSIHNHGGWLSLDEFQIVPQFVNIEPLEPSGAQTLSTIQVSHPTLAPQGVFEYQHSNGADLRESFRKGFENWAELDLPVFRELLLEKVETCSFMTLEPTEQGTSRLQHVRRVMFGPAQQMAQEPAGAEPEEHCFCPCCLFTNCHEAFEPLLYERGFHGIRLFAFRSATGEIEADCRVDGRDWPEGMEALKRYAAAWPQRGLEWRKQFVAIHTPEDIRHGDPGE